MTSKSTHAQAATLSALGLPKRKPDEGDRPPPSVFPGRRPTYIRGQLALGETVPEPSELPELPEEEADDAA
jgi:hypothetical protein